MESTSTCLPWAVEVKRMHYGWTIGMHLRAKLNLWLVNAEEMALLLPIMKVRLLGTKINFVVNCTWKCFFIHPMWIEWWKSYDSAEEFLITFRIFRWVCGPLFFGCGCSLFTLPITQKKKVPYSPKPFLPIVHFNWESQDTMLIFTLIFTKYVR